MQGFFESHISDVYLVSGLTFLVLAAVVAVLPRKDAALPHARDLWLIAAFGVLHGIHELTAMRAIQFPADGALPPWVAGTWVLVSYLPLFEFGRRLVWSSEFAIHSPVAAALLRPPVLYAAVAAPIAALTLWSANPSAGLEAGTRYFLGLPGALLSGAGLLLLLRRKDRQPALESIERPLWITALAALGYGLLTPVLTQGDPDLPAWLPTAKHFSDAFGFPVPVPRALTAVALTFGLATLVLGANTGVRQIEALLRLSERRLTEAQRIAQVGSWELDLRNNVLTWSDEIFRVFEIDKTRFGATYEAFLAAIHPDDREQVNAAYTRSVETREPYEIVHRLRMADGRIKHVHERCETQYDARGNAVLSMGTVQDITGRVAAEQALRESESRMRVLLAHAPIVVYSLDRHGVFTVSDGKELASLNRRPGEVVGRSAFEVFAHLPERLEHLRRGLRGEVFAAEVEMAGLWFDARHQPILGADGGVEGLVVVSTNITARRKAEQALQANEERLRTILERAPIGVVINDSEYRYTYWNPAAEKIFGFTRQEALGRHPCELAVPVENRQAWEAGMARLRKGEMDAHGTVVNVTKDGRRILCEWLNTPLFDAMGTFTGKLSMVQDVTVRRQSEAEMETARRRLESVLGSISDGFFTLNTQWIFTYVNERAARLVGKTPQELLNRPIWDVFPDAKGSAWLRRCRQVMESKQPLPFQEYYPHLDAWYEGAVYPFEDGISIYFHDFTEQKRAADRIVAQLQEKEVLLREIHHRVKNNLQIVSSLLYLQQQQSVSPENVEVLRESRNRVAAMALIHEKLYSSADLSRVDLVDYARDLAKSLFSSFGADPNQIRLRVDGDRFVLPLDRAISCGLLLNEIVSNSLKHAFPGGRAGQISITAAELADRYELTFQDDGIGHGITDLGQPRASLGLRLIPRLTAQLGGTIDRINGAGTGYRIGIPKEEPA